MSRFVHISRGQRPAAHAQSIKLVCLPHAGGAASSYRPWAAHLPKNVELYAVELPGRGSRFGEALVQNFDGLMDTLRSDLADTLDEQTVLFGHSLGAVVAFELARERHAAGVAPRALVVSGHAAPHLPGEDRAWSELDDLALRRELEELGGMPVEALRDDELMELALPIVRADLAVSESYVYRAGPPLPVPVIALNGTEDSEVGGDDIRAWRELAGGSFHWRSFAGDHFFLHARFAEVALWLLEAALGPTT